MRWPLILVALLVAIIVIIVAIGALLPQSHTAARRVTLAQPPERVFAILTDFAQTPTWRPDLMRVELLPAQNGHAMFREHGSDLITYRVEALDTPRHLIVRIADPNLPFGGTWTYDLAPTPGGGTHLTITERGEVYNPVFRFMTGRVALSARVALRVLAPRDDRPLPARAGHEPGRIGDARTGPVS